MFHRRAREEPEVQYVAMTEEEFDQMVALKLDYLLTIGGAAARYRVHLEQHGFIEPVAQQLAATWLANMQQNLV